MADGATGGDQILFDEADPLGTDQRWGNLAPMVVYLMVTGAVFTVPAVSGPGWFYWIGIVLALGWVAGFPLASGAEQEGRAHRWYRW